MPFNPTTGLYTPAAGATNAAAGQTIQATIWNNIFTDLAAALTELGPITPATYTIGTTIAIAQTNIICNGAGTVTLTLPSAVSYSGRGFNIKTVANQAVVSASSNIVPISTTSPGVVILAATAGKWASIVSDGTNWVIMSAN